MKRYPFSTAKHQHNLDTFATKCRNRMDDLTYGGEPEAYPGEYAELERKAEMADHYAHHLPLPVAYLTYPEWREATEMAQAQIAMRRIACIRSGNRHTDCY